MCGRHQRRCHPAVLSTASNSNPAWKGYEGQTDKARARETLAEYREGGSGELCPLSSLACCSAGSCNRRRSCTFQDIWFSSPACSVGLGPGEAPAPSLPPQPLCSIYLQPYATTYLSPGGCNQWINYTIAALSELLELAGTDLSCFQSQVLALSPGKGNLKLLLQRVLTWEAAVVYTVTLFVSAWERTSSSVPVAYAVTNGVQLVIALVACFATLKR